MPVKDPFYLRVGDLVCVITPSTGSVVGKLWSHSSSELVLIDPVILEPGEAENACIFRNFIAIEGSINLNIKKQLGWGPLRNELAEAYHRFIGVTKPQKEPYDSSEQIQESFDAFEDEWGDN